MDLTIDLAALPLPLRLRSASPLSDEDLLRFCAANDFFQIEREATGELLVMTPAGNRTGRRNAYLTQTMGMWADADGRGYSFDSNTGFSLADGSMLSPDAAWVSAVLWDALPEEEQDRFSHICPEFVIELRSPSDTLKTLAAKMEQWITNGAQLAWMIDPKERTVTVYRAGDSPVVHNEPSSMQGDGVVAGFELMMERVWR